MTAFGDTPQQPPTQISAALIAATLARFERQLTVAQTWERQVYDEVAQARAHEAAALVRALREADGRTSETPVADLSATDNQSLDAPDVYSGYAEALDAAREEAYQCRRALTELQRAVTWMTIFGTLAD